MAKNYQNDRENYIKACVKKEETLRTLNTQLDKALQELSSLEERTKDETNKESFYALKQAIEKKRQDVEFINNQIKKAESDSVLSTEEKKRIKTECDDYMNQRYKGLLDVFLKESKTLCDKIESVMIERREAAAFMNEVNPYNQENPCYTYPDVFNLTSTKERLKNDCARIEQFKEKVL